MPLDTGVRLGPYEIVSPIGAEAGGEVYKASDTEQNRTVAIKLLPPVLSNNSELRHRFEGEVKALSGLSHPHICTPHEMAGSRHGFSRNGICGGRDARQTSRARRPAA